MTSSVRVCYDSSQLSIYENAELTLVIVYFTNEKKTFNHLKSTKTTSVLRAETFV